MSCTLIVNAITTSLADGTGTTWIVGAWGFSCAGDVLYTTVSAIDDQVVCNSIDKCKLVDSSETQKHPANWEVISMGEGRART